MSRRRTKTQSNPTSPQQEPRRRNTKAERPFLNIGVSFLPEGKVEVDPKFNDALIEQLDVICSDSEEYDNRWEDDHKISYYIWTLMDGYLGQWDSPIAQEEVNATIPGVPHIKDSPVVDRVDISELEIIK